MRTKSIIGVIAVLGAIALLSTFSFSVALSLFIIIGSFSAFIAWGFSHDAKVAKQHADAQKVSLKLNF